MWDMRMPESMQRMDADILKYELGVNAVRTSHYPQSHYFIDQCDENRTSGIYGDSGMAAHR